MPLRLLQFSEINLAVWDACVAAATQPLPYAHSWWLQATAGRWEAVVEVDPQDPQRYLSLLPLPLKRRPWGREVFQPAFTQQLGLLTTAGSRHRAVGEYLALVSRRYRRFYQQLHVGTEPPAAWPAGFQASKRRTYLLDLSSDYAALLRGYAADYRRRLRLAAHLPPVPLDKLTELIQLFQAEKGDEAGLGATHYRQLEALFAALRPRERCEAWAVRDPATGQLLAGALFVRHPGRLIYLFAATSAAGKKASAPLVLLDFLIRHNAGTPGLVLDFEGSMIPGIARFFANFGAAPVPYVALSQTRLPAFLAWMRP